MIVPTVMRFDQDLFGWSFKRNRGNGWTPPHVSHLWYGWRSGNGNGHGMFCNELFAEDYKWRVRPEDF